MIIANQKMGAKGTYIGRPSHLGNPYREGKDGTREEVINKYREWIYRKILAKDEAVLKALSELKESSVLVCWCYPLACHGEVVEKAWRWAKNEGLLT